MGTRDKLVALLVAGLIITLIVIIREQAVIKSCMETGFLDILEKAARGHAEIHIHQVNNQSARSQVYHVVSGSLQLKLSPRDGDQGQANQSKHRDTNMAPTPAKGSQSKPVNVSGKKKVLLFAYMKGGSTFVGQLFNQFPNSMYLYEPIAGLYSAMYGTADWAFPLRVLLNTDGSFRKIPRHEFQTITQQTQHMFNCEVEKLPLEYLQHQGLWLSSSTFEYRRCLLDQVKSQLGVKNNRKEKKRARYLDHLMNPLQPHCPNSIQTCIRKGCDVFMNLSRSNQSEASIQFLLDLHPGLRNQSLFRDFRRMRRVFQHGVDQCLERLRIPCVTSQLLVVKALRLTMEMSGELLKKDPDLKLIYLVRDPRGTLVSREKVQYLSEVFRPDMEAEASLLCPKMARDVTSFEKMTSQFSDRVLLLRYEDAADRPQETVDNIYNFLGLRPPAAILRWVSANTHARSDGGSFDTRRANSSATAHAWRKKIAPTLKEKMDALCSNILLKLSYAL